MRYLPLLLLFFSCQTTKEVPAQPVTAATEAVARAVAHHDPDGRWPTFNSSFVLGRGDKRDTITIDQPGSYFAAVDGPTFYVADGETCRFAYAERGTGTQLSGRDLPLASDSCATVRLQQSYHTYLNGLPMKLQDPGTPLQDEVVTATFHGGEYLRLRVNYPKDGGTVETWEFFLDPDTYALGGYQFYRSDDPDGGEYLLLDGEIEVGGINMVESKEWFLRKDGKRLGEDVVLGEVDAERR